jgi:hypothetical protein
LNKKVLIISPYFPPVNAADMQRVRMSLPYFAALGWDAEVVTVDETYADLGKDDLLLQNVPAFTKVHKVKALNKNWTRRIGLGSIALRSLWFYRRKVNSLLKNEKFDLVYFSTTQFPVCVLGAYWKKRFGVPYIIDMQDPWYTTYYQYKPKGQRPANYKIVYAMHKYLEAIAMKQVSGLISVSEKYIDELRHRYPSFNHVPTAVIPFGAFEQDFNTADDNKAGFEPILDPATINVVYIGRGGMDLDKAIKPIFEALKRGLTNEPDLFNRLKLYFIGTSYAAAGRAIPGFASLIAQYGLGGTVVEIPERISHYHMLITLQRANALFIPGSDHPAYTASKIYFYLLAKKPLMAIFNASSPALKVLQEYGVQNAYSYDKTEEIDLKIASFFKQVINAQSTVPAYPTDAVKKYSAENMTRLQCELFNRVNQKI